MSDDVPTIKTIKLKEYFHPLNLLKMFHEETTKS